MSNIFKMSFIGFNIAFKQYANFHNKELFAGKLSWWTFTFWILLFKDVLLVTALFFLGTHLSTDAPSHTLQILSGPVRCACLWLPQTMPHQPRTNLATNTAQSDTHAHRYYNYILHYISVNGRHTKTHNYMRIWLSK